MSYDNPQNLEENDIFHSADELTGLIPIPAGNQW